MTIVRNRKWLFGLAVLASDYSLIGATDVAPRIVEFPGRVQSVPAPGSAGARIFYKYHMRDGSQDHPVFYQEAHSRPVRIATITRNMSVGWSPDGQQVFLQDNLGSNVADCYILKRVLGGVRGVTLLKIIQKVPKHPKEAESPAVSHYYVNCDGWQSSTKLAGSVNGHTDSNPMHDFDYKFTYDTEKRHLTWSGNSRPR